MIREVDDDVYLMDHLLFVTRGDVTLLHEENFHERVLNVCIVMLPNARVIRDRRRVLEMITER